jgi:hypothetical protein
VHACYRCGWKRGDDMLKPRQPINITATAAAAP